MTMDNRAQQPAGPRGTILYKGRARGVTVREACRIQGFDEYFLEGLDDKFATELIGEAVCTQHAGSILAEVMAAIIKLRAKTRKPHVADGLVDDLDVTDREDMLDHGSRAKFRVKTSHKGLTRTRVHRMYGHCGRDMLNMLPWILQFSPHTHYYREDDWHCEACQLAQSIHNRKPDVLSEPDGSRVVATTALGELVHIDPLGKARVACSLGGHNSALVMVDDFSRFVVVELLHRRWKCQTFFGSSANNIIRQSESDAIMNLQECSARHAKIWALFSNRRSHTFHIKTEWWSGTSDYYGHVHVPCEFRPLFQRHLIYTRWNMWRR